MLWPIELPTEPPTNAIDQLSCTHPLTCGGDRSDACHVQYQREHGGEMGELVVGEAGLLCPACGWKQPPSVGYQLAAAQARIAELELKSEPYCRCGRGKHDSQPMEEQIDADILESECYEERTAACVKAFDGMSTNVIKSLGTPQIINDKSVGLIVQFIGAPLETRPFVRIE